MGWLSGWSKRQAITLTGGADGAQVDFQLNLAIAYDSDMQSDFDDLRFTDVDGTTLIDSWLEDKIDSTSADIWVEFPTTPANGVEQTYYMYYDKSDALSDWDIVATFLLGDDFEDGSISGDWSQENTDASRTITEASGKLTIDVSNYNADWWSTVNTAPKVFQSIPLSDGYEIVIKLDSNSDANYNQSGVGVMESADHQSGIKLFKGYVTNDTVESQYLGGDISHYDTTQDTNILLKIRKATDWYFYYDLTGGGWNAVGSRAQTITDNEVTLYTTTAQSGGSQTGVFYYFYVKKYTANPPTYGFGSEENAPTILDFERAGMRGVMRGIMRGVA